MKKITFILFALAATGLTACASNSHMNGSHKHHDKKGYPHMGNPASIYCGEQGGETEIKTEANGAQDGYCHLPNGQVVEEWEFMRKNQGK